MDFWHWLLTICGSFLVLVILYALLGYIRRQRSSGRITIPPRFVAEIREAQQLAAQKQRDPRAGSRLIEVYEGIVGRLQIDENPLFYAAIHNDLGKTYSELPTGDRATNLTRAIAHFQEALRFLTAETAPSEYARIKSNLGSAYRDLPTSNREINLEQAIACYQEALRFLTAETAPFYYATIQSNLGLTYNQLPTGDRTVNLARAIVCYEEALRFRTLEAMPLEYARTQLNLGNVYYDLSTGDRGVNLAKAIACYQQALRVWTLETTPLDYAMAQNNLGLTYSELPTGDQEANLARAIAYYEEALRFRTKEIAPFEYADSQAKLGNAYYNLLTGDRTENLKQAITCYQHALRVWTAETKPYEYARTQNSLGNAYSELPTGDRAANLTQAIAHFQEASRSLTADTAPSEYADNQTELGNAYYNLLTGDRTENLKQAITCYQHALRVWTAETKPYEYARTQNSLGNAYSELPTGDRAANLAQAIACYREALRFRAPETTPLEYARTQANLGAAYSELPTGDRAANLTQAIAHFQEASRFLTVETAPTEYARTKSNLGNAYYFLPTGNREANLVEAIACYHEALRFLPAEAAPFEYADIQSNLGSAYSDLPTGDRAANLAKAIACYQEALRFRTPEATPLDYAMTQSNLGLAYSKLPTGDHAANLAKAIACYQEALRFRTPESTPLGYADTQNNLGLAYSDLPTGDHATNLAKAIACYQEALRFLTVDIEPFSCRRTNYNLADLQFAQREWNAALSAYRAAIDAGERLYLVGLSAESKSAEVAQNTALYRHAAFSAVRCGETVEALLLLERGKTRLLAEALRLRVLRPANVPDEVWLMFKDAGAAVRATQFQSITVLGEGRDLMQAYLARQENARNAHNVLDAAITRVREHDQNFLKEIDFPTVCNLIPDEHTALVAFCITIQGSIAFVLSTYHDKAVQIVDVPGFTENDLHHLFAEWDDDGRAVGGWLGAYRRHLIEGTQAANDAWKETITSSLAVLSQGLLAPVLSTLPPGVERIILLPSAELFLLPLHAASLSSKSSDLMCDRYQVSYAPSIEVLADTHANAVRVAAPDLYAVINPTADPGLPFTLTEGTAIARLFAQQKVDAERSGTKQRVLAGIQGRTHIHFACHGSYDWNDPTESGLELADERLTLAELQRGVVDLSAARLVTLSACETGISDVLKGSTEEYVGIPAGFLLASVPCVVSSLWAVPDLSTALLMQRFYQNHLSDGMDIVAALHAAQQWVRTLSIGEVAHYAEKCYREYRGGNTTKAQLLHYMRYYRLQAEQNPASRPFEHPSFWAAFTVNGS